MLFQAVWENPILRHCLNTVYFHEVNVGFLQYSENIHWKFSDSTNLQSQFFLFIQLILSYFFKNLIRKNRFDFFPEKFCQFQNFNTVILLFQIACYSACFLKNLDLFVMALSRLLISSWFLLRLRPFLEFFFYQNIHTVTENLQLLVSIGKKNKKS